MTTPRTFKFGRKRPVARPLGLRLRAFIDKGTIPNPPESVDYSQKAHDALAEMLLNDRLGCCTASAAFHTLAVLMGNAGTPIKPRDSDVEKFYSATTGYIPGNSATDQGGDEETVLNYWREKGLYTNHAPNPNHRILGHMRVNAADPTELKTALWLFENLYFGIEMPDAWVNPEPRRSGFTWDAAGAPVETNGHAFPAVGYNQHGMTISTWGMLGLMTFEAAAKYATARSGGETHVVISVDAINNVTQKAPSGFDRDGLVAQFRAMGGNLDGVA